MKKECTGEVIPKYKKTQHTSYDPYIDQLVITDVYVEQEPECGSCKKVTCPIE